MTDKLCDNCVNRDIVKPEGKPEFWACEEYGIMTYGVPADCTPPHNLACDFWTDDLKERNKRVHTLEELL